MIVISRWKLNTSKIRGSVLPSPKCIQAELLEPGLIQAALQGGIVFLDLMTVGGGLQGSYRAMTIRQGESGASLGESQTEPCG